MMDIEGCHGALGGELQHIGVTGLYINTRLRSVSRKEQPDLIGRE